MSRSVSEILQDIKEFRPLDGCWLPLDDLFVELWAAPVPENALPTFFRVFERFPDDDGAGVLWGVVHGIESLTIDYEIPLRDSLARQPSQMGKIMLGRLERSRAG